ncbi:MAG: DUF308 domain-containing protein [Oscillospiraceae bacterium]
MGWLYIIAIGFICVAYPILLFIVIWMLPWYVIVSYVIWLASCLSTTALSKGNRWYEKLAISFGLTLIFTFIIVAGVSNSDSYMFDNEKAVWLIAPVMNLPAIYFLGNAISKEIAVKKQFRVNELTNKVNEIISKNTPTKISNLKKAIPFDMAQNMTNQEVVLCVREYKESLKKAVIQRNEVDHKIHQLLSCNACTTIDQKYNHLTANVEILKELKAESDSLQKEITKSKIHLMNEDSSLLFELEKAFFALLQSKKCVGENFDIDKFICNDTPLELSLFNYKCAPVILFLNGFYYCLLSNVILVFDVNGVFSTAIDPTALNIMINKKTVNISVNNNTPNFNKYVAEDSNCIEQGSTRTTWAYTCRDGSPDLRRSYNPRIEYRTDIYEYAEIELNLAKNVLKLSVSSQNAIKSFSNLLPKYIRKCNNLHNPIPELLQLIQIAVEDEETMEPIFNTYELMNKRNRYFCNIM